MTCVVIIARAAGTHDLALLKLTLKKLSTAAEDELVLVPRYDKSMRGGRGDRAPEGDWTAVTGAACAAQRCTAQHRGATDSLPHSCAAGRPDVVLLEGWMLGFTPLQRCAAADEQIFLKYPSLKVCATLHAKPLFSQPHH